MIPLEDQRRSESPSVSIGKSYSLSWRLTLSLAATVACVLLLTAIVVYYSARNTLEEELDKKADEMLYFLAGALEIPLWNVDDKAIASIGDTLFQNPIVAELVITKPSEEVQYASRREFGAPSILRTSQIYSHGETVGDIRLVVTAQEMHERLRNLLRLLIMMTTLVLSTLLLVTGWFVRRYLRAPLTILNQHIAAYAAGTYDAPAVAPLPYLELQPFERVLIRMGKTIQHQMEALRQNEEKYRVLFESFPLGITITDPTGNILETNVMAEKLLEVSASEQIQRAIDGGEWSIIRPDGSPMPTQEYASTQALQNNHVVENVEMGIINPNGKVIWLNVTAAPIPLERYGVAITYKDITARKNAEEALRLLNNELELRVSRRTAALNAVNAELQEFAYIVSHDLKAPLRGITRLAQWLKADYTDVLDETGQEQLELMIDRVRRMNDLIDGVLAYSRAARGSEREESVDLNSLIPQIIDILAIPDDVTIQIENTLPTIVADPIKVSQVFQNLLSNAVKCIEQQHDGSGSSGKISIAVEDAGEMWTFHVEDNGPGIERRQHERIFQIFQTNNSENTQEGTGIGLTLVKKVVEYYHGRVWVESEPGYGSRFYFTWPKRQQQEGTS